MRPYSPTTRATLAIDQACDERGERAWPIGANTSLHQLIRLHYPRIRQMRFCQTHAHHIFVWSAYTAALELASSITSKRPRHQRRAPPDMILNAEPRQGCHGCTGLPSLQRLYCPEIYVRWANSGGNECPSGASISHSTVTLGCISCDSEASH